MQAEARAKINWTLDITGRRDDGYHLLDMLLQTVSLSDTITVEAGEGLSMTAEGGSGIPTDEHNLMMKAALALQKRTGVTKGARMHLVKRIPSGAGMGGGSADAAMVLKMLNGLWQTGLNDRELREVGLTVGADVPYCLTGGLCRVRGIGEDITLCANGPLCWLTVVKPRTSLATGGIFSLYHELERLPSPDNDRALSLLTAGNIRALPPYLGNVLTAPAVHRCPEIAEAIEAMQALGAAAAQMTGSGSAVFGVWSNEQEARAAAEKLRAKWSDVFVCHTEQA